MRVEQKMDFWPEFLASSWGKEFIAGGIGGMAGVVSGYPLDTLRIRLQQPSNTSSAFSLMRNIVSNEGPAALYRGMGAPLASVTFQNAAVFQAFASLSRALSSSSNSTDPPSYKNVALAGFGTGAIQSFLLSPVELLKIRLQVQSDKHPHQAKQAGPMNLAKEIFKREGVRGIFRGLNITMLRDAPAHAVYFWTYEYTRELLHPGCRKDGHETVRTMLVAGGLAGVASWVFCYPLDVVKSRLQAQSLPKLGEPPLKYAGIVDCFRKSVTEEGYRVLFRGLGAAVARAFVVNGTIFAAYELSLRLLFSNNNQKTYQTEESGL